MAQLFISIVKVSPTLIASCFRDIQFGLFCTLASCAGTSDWVLGITDSPKAEAVYKKLHSLRKVHFFHRLSLQLTSVKCCIKNYEK